MPWRSVLGAAPNSFDQLIREAAHARHVLADDPRWVGATLGVLAVLHTWGRDLG